MKTCKMIEKILQVKVERGLLQNGIWKKLTNCNVQPQYNHDFCLKMNPFDSSPIEKNQ